MGVFLHVIIVLVINTNSFNALLSGLKTDLRLLLECLKFQMKCPDLQKQALLTIHSICEKRGNMTVTPLKCQQSIVIIDSAL